MTDGDFSGLGSPRLWAESSSPAPVLMISAGRGFVKKSRVVLPANPFHCQRKAAPHEFEGARQVTNFVLAF